MTQDISVKIRNFIIVNFLFGDSSNGLKDTDSFLENGVIDSTGVLELVSFLEENFGIEVADEELIPENLDSIKSISRFIQERLELPGELQHSSTASLQN